MRPTRSLLFVPGNREEWLENAHLHEADLVVLDLEDSVPPSEKQRARELVSEYVPKITAHGQRVSVRINGHPNQPTEETGEDIEAVISEHISALFIPKLNTAEDIAALESVLCHLENRDNLETTDVIVALETAQGVRNTYDICTASDRLAGVVCGAVPGTDLSHDVGFKWTGPGREGLETVHIRQKVLLDSRAAGTHQAFAGAYVDIDNQESLLDDMAFYREIGYDGYVLIHPSQVESANKMFTPDAEAVEYWLGVKEALTEAMADGKSTTRFQGDMVDTANLKTAKKVLRKAKAFNVDINEELPESID